MKLHGYLTDDQGHKSSARLNSFIALITAVVIGLMAAYSVLFLPYKEISALIVLVSTFLGYSAGVKLGQKNMETKDIKVQEETKDIVEKK